jgi:hypothetical protein
MKAKQRKILWERSCRADRNFAVTTIALMIFFVAAAFGAWRPAPFACTVDKTSVKPFLKTASARHWACSSRSAAIGAPSAPLKKPLRARITKGGGQCICAALMTFEPARKLGR